MIYVYGDSHVSLFTGKDEVLPESPEWKDFGEYKICRIGAKTAYNINKESYYVEHIKRLPVGSEVILSFGEIDCRRHIGKHKNTEDVVERYFQYIDKLVGYKITLLLPPASHPEEMRVEGTPIERNLITKEFIILCKKEADKRNINCIDIFHLLVDESLNTKVEFYYDTCHVKSCILKI